MAVGRKWKQQFMVSFMQKICKAKQACQPRGSCMGPGDRLLCVVELKNKLKKTEHILISRITEQQIWALTGGPFIFWLCKGHLSLHLHLCTTSIWLFLKNISLEGNKSLISPGPPVDAVIWSLCKELELVKSFSVDWNRKNIWNECVNGAGCKNEWESEQ